MVREYKNEKFKEEYKKKLLSVEDAAKLVNSGDVLMAAVTENLPTPLLAAIGKRSLTGEITDIELTGQGPAPNLPLDWATFENKKNMRFNTAFIVNGRKQVSEGIGEYLPAHANDIPDMLLNYKVKGRKPGTVKVLIGAAPMDKFGYFSVGAGPGYAIEPAREENTTVIVVVNENLPYIYGDSFLHISEVDHVVEDNYPLVEPTLAPETETETSMAAHVAELVEDGATLQLGWGGLPNVIGKMLVNRKDLGAHSEQVGDAFMSLWEAGALTGNLKTVKPRRITGCFAFGSKKLYEWLDHNPAVEMYSQKWTNDPFVIAQNYKLTAVNQILEIDFSGQASAESIGTYQYSGPGGQPAFSQGAKRSPGGKSILCLRATAQTKDGLISNIVPILKPGTTVTTSRNDIQYVITEYGIAQLEGKTIPERAKELISIAHPDFRAELRKEAEKLKYYY